MSNEDLLKLRYKLIADYPRNEQYENIEVGEVIDAWKPNKVIQKNFTNFYDKYPHLFQKLEWWEDRKIEDMPMYLKQTGMVDSKDNPIPDWHLKVKKHFSAGNGEWRDNSIRIFCTEDHKDGWGSGNRSMSYNSFEPSTEEEYLSSLAQLETANR